VWVADAEGRRELPVEEITPTAASATQLESMTSQELPAYTKLAQAFAGAIRGEAPEGDVPLPTFVDGVRALDVMDAARRSAAAHGATVTVTTSNT
jgi:predicted dehydrogenase